MTDRTVRIWSPLSSSTVSVEMGEFQLQALINFLRTGKDEQHPDWPEHFANQLEGKHPLGIEPVNKDLPASDAVPF